MLKDILSVPGKTGLFKLISQGKNMLIVESLIDKKRLPVLAHEKVIALSDIAIFTEEEEISLGDVLNLIKEKEAGKKSTINPKADGKMLVDFFAEVLPNFDRDRVRASDIKKIISWYNTLIDAGFTDFSKKEEKSSVDK